MPLLVTHMLDNQSIIATVKQWLEKIVIGLELCPFAKKTFDSDKIRYAVSDSTDVESLMLVLHDELKLLEENPSIETTLVIIHQQLDGFESFNQVLDFVDNLLEQYDWIGVFQVASFHPQYQFSGTDIDDRENWTNRSPYPILHLLRESSLEQAIEKYPNVDDIPQRNIKTLNTLSDQQFAQIFLTNHA